MSKMDLSIIIPFKDKSKMTAKCVETLLQFNPDIKEILLVSNNSQQGEIDYLKDKFQNSKNIKVAEYNYPFNYQKINNWGVSQSSGKFILFLNNDTEFTPASAGLIEKLYKRAQNPKTGIVGCLLLYGDEKTIQHAGVYLRPGLQGDHLYVGKSYRKALRDAGSKEFPYDIGKPRAVTACTGALQLIEREKFDTVKGYDENFIICGGDVDLCLRLNQVGYQTWYESGGYVIHKESQSRAYKPIPYIDFYLSYISYMKGYDLEIGDPFLPKITEVMK